MSRLKPEQMQRALDMHRECMEDPEYAEKWNALMDQMGRFLPGIPDEAKRPAETAPEVDWSWGRGKGCCSASSPCAHQKQSPTTLCEVCQQAADRAASYALTGKDGATP